MADNKPGDQLDDEFNFEAESQDFGSANLELNAPSQKKLAKGPVVVGGLVVAFVLWKLWGFIFSGSDKPAEPVVLQKPEEVKVEDNNVPMTGENMVAPSPDAPGSDMSGLDSTQNPQAAPASNMTNDSSDPKLKESLAKLEESNAQLQSRLSNLEESLKQMAMNLNGYQQSVNGINQNIDKVSSAVTELSSSIKSGGMSASAPPPSMGVAPSGPPAAMDMTMGDSSAPMRAEFANPEVTIHAIIPGRVWLKDKSGKTSTYVEGDDVASYGKIVAIDAPNGMVLTSSGMKLR